MHRAIYRGIGSVVLLLWALGGGCLAPLSSLKGLPCEKDSHCGPDLRCLDGICGGGEASSERPAEPSSETSTERGEEADQEKSPEQSKEEVAREEFSPQEPSREEVARDKPPVEIPGEEKPKPEEVVLEEVPTGDGGEDHPEEPATERSCPAGAKRSCYTGAAGTQGVGPCQSGTQTCAQGAWGPCQGEVTPQKESCNGKDDDCNGKTDDGLQAPRCSKQDGVCQGSRKTCDGSKGWKDCTDANRGQHSPLFEKEEVSCDGKDNDCDGQTDETFREKGLTCNIPTNKGICAEGNYRCHRGKLSCVQRNQPKTEVCGNSQDDDCDGLVDENPPCNCKAQESEECYTPASGCSKSKKSYSCQGICKAGSRTCDNQGQWGACVGEVGPATEKCDGQDNNCNGRTDETFPKKNQPCSSGQKGICAQGRWICHRGAEKCESLYPKPPPEVCANSKDDDCDGLVDENPPCICQKGSNKNCYPSGVTGCTQQTGSYQCVGECATGQSVCVDGKSWGTCQGYTGPQAEICDGKDNDCNGTTDDMYPLTCGKGICQRTVSACDSNGARTCTPGAGLARERCTTPKDDNCNGLTNENCTTCVNWRHLYTAPAKGRGFVAFSGNNLLYYAVSTNVYVRGRDLTKPQPLKVSIVGELHGIASLAVSPDGNWIAAGFLRNDKIKVWDKAGALKYTLSGHTKTVHSLAFSDDNNLLASGSADTNVKVWEMNNKGRLKETYSKHTDTITSLSFYKHNWLASGSKDGDVIIWDVSGSIAPRTLLLATVGSPVTSVAFRPDLKFIAAGYQAGNVQIWETGSTWAYHKQLQAHTQAVTSLAWSPDNKTLVTASEDKTTLFWETTGWKKTQTLRGHSHPVTSVAFNKDGKRLATASFFQFLVWESATGKQQKSLVSDSREIKAISWSRDGRHLAGATGIYVTIWDEKGNQQYLLRAHSKAVNDVAYSPDEKHLATASSDGRVILWEVSGYKATTPPLNHSKEALSLAFGPGGKILAVGLQGGEIRLWEAEKKTLFRNLSTGLTAGVQHLAFSPNGKTLVSSSGKILQLWDLTQQKLLFNLSAHNNTISGLAWNPNGQEFVSVSVDGQIKTWDAKGNSLQSYQVQGGALSGAAWNPNGSSILTGQNKTSPASSLAVLFGTSLKTVKQSLAGHSGPILDVAFSPTTYNLAISSSDKTIHIWNCP